MFRKLSRLGVRRRAAKMKVPYICIEKIWLLITIIPGPLTLLCSKLGFSKNCSSSLSHLMSSQRLLPSLPLSSVASPFHLVLVSLPHSLSLSGSPCFPFVSRSFVTRTRSILLRLLLSSSTSTPPYIIIPSSLKTKKKNRRR